MNDNLITSCCDAAPIVESIDYDSIDDIDFCLEEFEEKHGDTKTPEIVLTNEAGKITVRADNY